jgi:Glycosyl transferase family 2
MDSWLTIGMPVYDDFDGAVFSLQSLRMHHDLSGVELLVVDQRPDSPQGQALRRFCGRAKVRYIPFTERIGTAPAKDHVIRSATTHWVMCMDAHVLLGRDALSEFRQSVLYRGKLHSDRESGLIFGSMLHDGLNRASVGLSDRWSGGMLGQWIDVELRDSSEIGYDSVSSHGGGLFVVRQDEWPGFPAGMRGFGGEEGYLPAKYRQAGLPVRRLNSLRWWHRFDRPAGVPYRATLEDKCRNYLIGWLDLGRDVAEVRHHFVTEMKLPAATFDRLLADAGPDQTEKPACRTPAALLCEAWYQHCLDAPGYGKILPKIRDLATGCKVVKQSSPLPGRSFVAAMAAGPKTLIGVFPPTVPPALIESYRRCLPPETHLTAEGYVEDETFNNMSDCELLILDGILQADSVFANLLFYATPSLDRICILGDRVSGEAYQSGPGLLPGLRKFLAERPEYSVIEHIPEGPGLIVLSRLTSDKPALPSGPRMAWNYARSMAAHIAAGRAVCPEPEAARRLELCQLCPSRNGDRCAACGCWLESKAAMEVSTCPLGRW